MLDFAIRILAHVLTPLFLIGMAGSTLLVASKLGSDVMEFLQDDAPEHTTKDRG